MNFESVKVNLLSQDSLFQHVDQSNKSANEVIRECAKFIKVLDKAIAGVDK